MLGIFIDIETTGLDPFRHRVLEVAIKVVDLNHGTVEGTFETVVRQPYRVWRRRDPVSLKVNGFSWKMMRRGIPEKAAREAILSFFERCGIKRGQAVFIAQNSSFDRSFFAQLVEINTQEKLKWPYHWLDLASMYWALHGGDIRGAADLSLSKNGIAKRYGLPPEETPHRALGGVNHLIACFQALMHEH